VLGDFGEMAVVLGDVQTQILGEMPRRRWTNEGKLLKRDNRLAMDPVPKT
jgi:hypothetical protein